MVPKQEILRAWGAVLTGRKPALSIEITKECPLRCPGCYAFGSDHVAPGIDLRTLHDLRGEALVEGVMALVHRYRPLHLSLVGGDPLVRYRELEAIVPRALAEGVFVQVVTSAFRPPPASWAGLDRFELAVSIDGLAADHDRRRAPATYERILKNIAGHQVVVHCTLTAPMARQAGYLEAFVDFWAGNPHVKKIWMSIFTPQRGAELEEIPSPEERERMIVELERLRGLYPALDMRPGVLAAMRRPPQSPRECIFARATRVVSADLESEIGPCQFGGEPDCGRCGCYASMGAAAIGHHRLPGGLTPGAIFHASADIGDWLTGRRRDGYQAARSASSTLSSRTERVARSTSSTRP